MGGIGFYIVFLLAIVIYSALNAETNIFADKSSMGFIGCTGLAFMMGLADDAYNTKPLLKLGTQVACGLLLIATGTLIQTFPEDWMNYTITILWVVGIMNSINMLDNMDGISSVVASFILINALAYMGLHGETSRFEFVAILGVLAGIGGFLFYNWHPSKMFMGDTGSQFLGIFLAFIGIKFFWNSQGLDGSIIQSRQIVLVLMAFLLPITDTTIVTINRLSRKQSPFIGGKDHTTHNLSYLGLTDSQVAFVFVLLSVLITFICALIMRFINDWNHLYTVSFSIFMLIVIGVFFGITVYNKKRNNEES